MAPTLTPQRSSTPMSFQLLADGRGEVRVVAQQGVRRALQHGHAQAVAAQRVGGFHADVARADDHRAPGLLLAR